MSIVAPAALLAALAATTAGADAASDLAHRLQEFPATAPVTVDLRLELRMERTTHHQTAKGEASLRLDVEQGADGLRIRWEPGLLRDADAEERERDREPGRLTPLREGLKELDPARVGHLLDQAGSLAGLTKGSPVEERAEAYEGRAARQLVYRFQPRLPWTEAYYVHHREGRFTVWIATDGTPLASESLATYDGKTSRMFGRFKGATTVRTVYAAEGARLRVAEREVDETSSREDGAEVEHTWRRFVLARR